MQGIPQSRDQKNEIEIRKKSRTWHVKKGRENEAREKKMEWEKKMKWENYVFSRKYSGKYPLRWIPYLFWYHIRKHVIHRYREKSLKNYCIDDTWNDTRMRNIGTNESTMWLI